MGSAVPIPSWTSWVSGLPGQQSCQVGGWVQATVGPEQRIVGPGEVRAGPTQWEGERSSASRSHGLGGSSRRRRGGLQRAERQPGTGLAAASCVRTLFASWWEHSGVGTEAATAGWDGPAGRQTGAAGRYAVARSLCGNPPGRAVLCHLPQRPVCLSPCVQLRGRGAWARRWRAAACVSSPSLGCWEARQPLVTPVARPPGTLSKAR